MMNLNDTISAFRCCTQIPPMCKECPFTEMCKWNLSKDRCKNEVKLSVNHWLKAQEPRVMTLEEVLHLRFDDVVFLELSVTGVVISAIVIDVIEHMPDGDIGLIQFRHIQEPTNNADLEYYGKTWRCWTSRPTKEQMEATPWN